MICSAERTPACSRPNTRCTSACVSAAIATGAYLAFLDSDDLLFPWALDTYDFVLVHTGQPALVVSRLFSFSHEPPAPGAAISAADPPLPPDIDRSADHGR